MSGLVSLAQYTVHSQIANAVSVLSVGILGIMHHRLFVAIDSDALSGQSELGSLTVETCICWRAPSRAPCGSGARN